MRRAGGRAGVPVPRRRRAAGRPAKIAGDRPSADGFAQVAMLADKRCCVLLKTRIGYKGNFEGVLLCSAPLHPGEIVHAGAPAREYITLPGQGVFEELYLRRRIDERRFDVYFDLN